MPIPLRETLHEGRISAFFGCKRSIGCKILDGQYLLDKIVNQTCFTTFVFESGFCYLYLKKGAARFYTNAFGRGHEMALDYDSIRTWILMRKLVLCVSILFRRAIRD